jgi:hypothetical protein
VNNFDRTEKGSLWQFVNRCKTPFGRRLLKEWLCHPLYRAADIARRAAAVEELLTSSGDQADMARSCLKGIPDLERLLARVHSNALQKKKGLEHPSNRAILYVFCYTLVLPSFLLFLFVMSLSVCQSLYLLSVSCCMSALSDTTWHESNHHLTPPLNQSIDTILITMQVRTAQVQQEQDPGLRRHPFGI